MKFQLEINGINFVYKIKYDLDYRDKNNGIKKS
jgi:hypothetical protein